MVISVSASFQAQIDRDSGQEPCYLIDMDFNITGPRRFTTWKYDLSFQSHTYDAMAALTFDPPVADTNTPLTDQTCLFEVQNDASLLQDLQQNSRARLANMYFSFVLGAGTLVNSGEAIHKVQRRMVPGNIQVSRETYLSNLSLESTFWRSKYRAPRTYSHAEQQRIDATDFCLVDTGNEFDVSHPDWVQKSGLAK
jgi:hypothetical protein